MRFLVYLLHCPSLTKTMKIFVYPMKATRFLSSRAMLPLTRRSARMDNDSPIISHIYKVHHQTCCPQLSAIGINRIIQHLLQSSRTSVLQRNPIQLSLPTSPRLPSPKSQPLPSPLSSHHEHRHSTRLRDPTIHLHGRRAALGRRHLQRTVHCLGDLPAL